MCKLAKYVRKCVNFRKNLLSWQKFYTTAGRDGRDKFQVCLPYQKFLFFHVIIFCHLFKMFLFSFLFNFVWNILCRHLLLTIYFLFHTFFSFFVLFSSFTWCIICHISFTWCILCQHLGPTCHLLSLRHFILPWHSHRHFIFTLWSYLYTL